MKNDPTITVIPPSKPTSPVPSVALRKSVLVTLAGNPNSGKTSVFNSLTGARQRVGNYPGVTVEKKSGSLRHGSLNIEIVDLPGIYSLAAHTIEERVARDFLLKESPEVVIHVVDSSNLDRNLYLTTQLLELGMNVVLDLNMADLMVREGIRVDRAMLSERLGVDVVETVANRGKGFDRLIETVGRNVDRNTRPLAIDYGREINAEIDALEKMVFESHPEGAPFPHRWTAVKLLENDAEVCAWVRAHHPQGGRILEEAQRSAQKIRNFLGDSAEALIADRRYGFVAGLIRESVIRDSGVRRIRTSEKIDAVLLHRILGIPIFLAMMYLVFHLTFTLGKPPMDWLESGTGLLSGFLKGVMAEGPLRSLIVDGIIGGVGGVLVFLPNILLLFLALAILEDSGYMARAAFLMDRIMHRIGLHGRSFIPMVTGFGCTVPGIMATRTLDNERDRLATIFVLPLMSCGARLPIYTLIIAAFFPINYRGPILFGVYLIGIILAVILVKFLRVSVLAGESTPFVMELPPYRCPTSRSIIGHMWQRSLLYLKKAGTLILGISIIVWALSSYPSKEVYEIDRSPLAASLSEEELEARRSREDLQYSAAGRIGTGLSYVLKPCGFDWRISTALIGAFAAKEVFVAQMGIVLSMGNVEEEGARMGLSDTIRKEYPPLVGVCIMLFCLIATPCMATVAVVRRETNSWKWPIFQFITLTTIGYLVSMAAYQLGSALGIGI